MAPSQMPVNAPVLDVQNLRVSFLQQRKRIDVVRGISFSVEKRETVVIVGESGSGKSVTLRSIMKLHPARRSTTTGTIRFAGRDVLSLSEGAVARLRGREIGMVFQEPALAFDPVFTIGQQLVETIVRHDAIDHGSARRRALELLEQVQIPSAVQRFNAYPHEMSGGMLQRAMIAVALSGRPKLLLADEPTTALDATVQVQILLLLRELQKTADTAVIFVTHDLGVAAEMADRVGVMYAGEFVELGPVGDVLKFPKHPYTQGLLASTVSAERRRNPLSPILGSPPAFGTHLLGCAFAPRCTHRMTDCDRFPPDITTLAGEHSIRCHLMRGSSGPAEKPVAI